MTEIVVTVTPTVQDGTVVRWYDSLAAAEHRTDPIVAGARPGRVAPPAAGRPRHHRARLDTALPHTPTVGRIDDTEVAGA